MILTSDFVIVGSGVAALRAAIDLAQAGTVTILTKAETTEGSTGYAQGGIAAPLGPDDSVALHVADTLAAGDGLCDAHAVEIMIEAAPRYVMELVEWGAAFDRDGDGTLALAREGAHSVRRVLHAHDSTGREIGAALWRRASQAASMRVIEHARATRLLVTDGVCTGVEYVDRFGAVGAAVARATMLATGGAGRVFRETTNPPVATGDGIAIGYLAGARVVDLEFVQFHPTALAAPDQPRFLLSEALRGEGARLVNMQGEAFMTRYDPAGDLAPRDRVARAIVRESNRTGDPICLSLRHLDAEFVHTRFPLLSAVCRRAGLDLARDLIPVGPAAHYVMGGLETDLDGSTSIPGLFAAGEVACTGVHGANRLASNSLLEGLVFGARGAAGMLAYARRAVAIEHRDVDAVVHGGVDLSLPDVQDVMWRLVGLFREREGLLEATRTLEAAWTGKGEPPTGLAASPEDATAPLLVGLLMARAALRRTESRGAHYRSDFPARDEIHWNRRVFEARHEVA